MSLVYVSGLSIQPRTSRISSKSLLSASLNSRSNQLNFRQFDHKPCQEFINIDPEKENGVRERQLCTSKPFKVTKFPQRLWSPGFMLSSLVVQSCTPASVGLLRIDQISLVEFVSALKEVVRATESTLGSPLRWWQVFDDLSPSPEIYYLEAITVIEERVAGGLPQQRFVIYKQLGTFASHETVIETC